MKGVRPRRWVARLIFFSCAAVGRAFVPLFLVSSFPLPSLRQETYMHDTLFCLVQHFFLSLSLPVLFLSRALSKPGIGKTCCLLRPQTNTASAPLLSLLQKSTCFSRKDFTMFAANGIPWARLGVSYCLLLGRGGDFVHLNPNTITGSAKKAGFSWRKNVMVYTRKCLGCRSHTGR